MAQSREQFIQKNQKLIIQSLAKESLIDKNYYQLKLNILNQRRELAKGVKI
jgi:hypothetical protein